MCYEQARAIKKYFTSGALRLILGISNKDLNENAENKLRNTTESLIRQISL